MSRSEKKRATAERALERAVEEETVAIRAELKAAQAQVKALHAVLSKIGGIAFGATAAEIAIAGQPEKRTLPADLAIAAAPQQDEPLAQEPPIDLAGEDNMGAGRWI